MTLRAPPSMQMRAPGDSRFLSYDGDLAHNVERLAHMFHASLGGAYASEIFRAFKTTRSELTAGYAVFINALRLGVSQPHWEYSKCLYEVGWMNLQPNIRFGVASLYGYSVMQLQALRVRQAKIGSSGGMPSSSPIDDVFKKDLSFDIAAALIEVAPDGIKAPVDLDTVSG